MVIDNSGIMCSMKVKELKDFCKKQIIKVLAWESKKILDKFQPKIIGITGNVGKTTTKDYIYTVLKTKYGAKVLESKNSQNSEFGVCLTILNSKNPWNNPFAWIYLITVRFLKVYFGKVYFEVLILEIGADHKGDIKHITSFVKPDVVVLTAFQDKPSHGEFFKNLEEHVREKQYLVDVLKDDGILLFNNEDKILKNLVRSDHNSFSYGKRAGSIVEILGVHDFYENDKVMGVKVILKQNLTEELGITEIILRGVLGEAHGYSVAASVLIGFIEQMEKKEIEMSFDDMGEDSLAKSRMRILQGINDSIIIDDSYNASPDAYKNALNSLANIETKARKIVVLGHMAELGENTETAHIEAGNLAGKVADAVIISGKHQDYFLMGLEQSGFPMENLRLAKNADEVYKIIFENNLLESGDVILVKGSQSARLERVVVKLLSNKEDSKFVCRQNKEWKKRS